MSENVRFSDLDAADLPLADGDLIYVVQTGGADRKTTVEDLREAIE